MQGPLIYQMQVWTGLPSFWATEIFWQLNLKYNVGSYLSISGIIILLVLYVLTGCYYVKVNYH